MRAAARRLPGRRVGHDDRPRGRLCQARVADGRDESARVRRPANCRGLKAVSLWLRRGPRPGPRAGRSPLPRPVRRADRLLMRRRLLVSVFAHSRCAVGVGGRRRERSRRPGKAPRWLGNAAAAVHRLLRPGLQRRLGGRRRKDRASVLVGPRRCAQVRLRLPPPRRAVEALALVARAVPAVAVAATRPAPDVPRAAPALRSGRLVGVARDAAAADRGERCVVKVAVWAAPHLATTSSSRSI